MSTTPRDKIVPSGAFGQPSKDNQQDNFFDVPGLMKSNSNQSNASTIVADSPVMLDGAATSAVTRIRPAPKPLAIPSASEAQQLADDQNKSAGMQRQFSVKKSPFVTPQTSIQPMDFNLRVGERNQEFIENMEAGTVDFLSEIQDGHLAKIPFLPFEETDISNLKHGDDRTNKKSHKNVDANLPNITEEAKANSRTPSDVVTPPHNSAMFPVGYGLPRPAMTSVEAPATIQLVSGHGKAGPHRSLSTQISVQANEELYKAVQEALSRPEPPNMSENDESISSDVSHRLPPGLTRPVAPPNMSGLSISGTQSPRLGTISDGNRAASPQQFIENVVEQELSKVVKEQPRGAKDWMTPEILQGIKDRDELFTLMKTHPQDKKIAAEYKKRRNQVVTLTRRAKREMKNQLRPMMEQHVIHTLHVDSTPHQSSINTTGHNSPQLLHATHQRSGSAGSGTFTPRSRLANRAEDGFNASGTASPLHRAGTSSPRAPSHYLQASVAGSSTGFQRFHSPHGSGYNSPRPIGSGYSTPKSLAPANIHRQPLGPPSAATVGGNNTEMNASHQTSSPTITRRHFGQQPRTDYIPGENWHAHEKENRFTGPAVGGLGPIGPRTDATFDYTSQASASSRPKQTPSKLALSSASFRDRSFSGPVKNNSTYFYPNVPQPAGDDHVFTQSTPTKRAGAQAQQTRRRFSTEDLAAADSPMSFKSSSERSFELSPGGFGHHLDYAQNKGSSTEIRALRASNHGGLPARSQEANFVGAFGARAEHVKISGNYDSLFDSPGWSERNALKPSWVELGREGVTWEDWRDCPRQSNPTFQVRTATFPTRAPMRQSDAYGQGRSGFSPIYEGLLYPNAFKNSNDPNSESNALFYREAQTDNTSSHARHSSPRRPDNRGSLAPSTLESTRGYHSAESTPLNFRRAALGNQNGSQADSRSHDQL